MIYIDFETRSACDLSAAGPYLYARHPSTEIICLCYAIDDGEVDAWTPGEGPFPPALRDAIDGGHWVEAHNAAFERNIWEVFLQNDVPIAPHQWRCSMARAAALGLPQALEDLARFLGTSEQKDAAGRKLMLRASLPARSKGGRDLFGEVPKVFFDRDPALIARVVDYCRQDVRTERAVSKLLPGLSKDELKVWQVDQAINSRGIKIDRALCENAVAFVAKASSALCDELRDLTGGEVGSPTEVAKLRGWLVGQGVDLDSLNADAVEEAVGTLPAGPARRALEIRQEAGRSSVAKFGALLERASPIDDRIRDILRYHGGFVGRWAGVGPQIQNFPRGTEANVDALANTFATGDFELFDLFWGSVFDAAVSALRPALVAPSGHSLLVWDFGQIEARVLADVAGCRKLSGLFASGADVYRSFASEAFGKHPDKITKDERFIGKTCVLGLGYGMGAAKLQLSLVKELPSITLGLCERLVNVFRSTYPEIPALWRRLETEFLQVAGDGSPTRTYRKRTLGKLSYIAAKVPSGREFAYISPRVVAGKVTYSKNYNGSMTVADTYGAKLVENFVQAAARDVMAAGMVRLFDAGFLLDATVHDEIVAEAPDAEAAERLEEGRKILEEPPAWCGARLKVEGFVSKRYRK